jgi:cation transport regulator ChaB
VASQIVSLRRPSEVVLPAEQELPSTLRRSSSKAQETWSKAHDSAVETYGEGERAHRTAFAALKHSFEKVGDRWEPKRRKGPSDPQAARRGRPARLGQGRTYGGVDVEGRTKRELIDLARRLDVPGRSRMTKEELGTAIARANDRATSRARERST